MGLKYRGLFFCSSSVMEIQLFHNLTFDSERKRCTLFPLLTIFSPVFFTVSFPLLACVRFFFFLSSSLVTFPFIHYSKSLIFPRLLFSSFPFSSFLTFPLFCPVLISLLSSFSGFPSSSCFFLSSPVLPLLTCLLLSNTSPSPALFSFICSRSSFLSSIVYGFWGHEWSLMRSRTSDLTWCGVGCTDMRGQGKASMINHL